MREKLYIKDAWQGKENVFLRVGRYADRDRMYVGLVCEDGEPYDDLTVNLPDVPMAEAQACLNTNHLPYAVEFVEKYHLAVKSGLLVKSGFCTYPVYLFDLERLREFDPEGVADYEASCEVKRKGEGKA